MGTGWNQAHPGVAAVVHMGEGMPPSVTDRDRTLRGIAGSSAGRSASSRLGSTSASQPKQQPYRPSCSLQVWLVIGGRVCLCWPYTRRMQAIPAAEIDAANVIWF